jgi:hypothetical protein
VIAYKAIPQRKPDPKPQPQHRTYVRAREAAHRRARRTRAHGYALMLRIVTVVGVVLLPVMIYVLLMGNLTALNYTLARDTQLKSDLQAETTRLDDRIAQLESRERLADVANRLHLHDPTAYAIVDVPRPAVAPPANGIAFLGAFFHR